MAHGKVSMPEPSRFLNGEEEVLGREEERLPLTAPHVPPPE